VWKTFAVKFVCSIDAVYSKMSFFIVSGKGQIAGVIVQKGY
jgi:hypothetical protein